MEEWRDVVGYEGLYQVSNLGRVKSLDRITVYACGKCKKHSGRILKFSEYRGYYQISLSKNNKAISIAVHRLIASAFISARPEGLVVDHIDQNRKNNTPENLRYTTYSENTRNSTARKNRGVKYVGVYRRKQGKWLAGITVNRKRLHIGCYEDDITAARAYDAYCIKNKLDRELNNA